MKRKETSAFKEILEEQHNFDDVFTVDRKKTQTTSVYKPKRFRFLTSLLEGDCFLMFCNKQSKLCTVWRMILNVRQSIDGPCEQTFMNSSKTAGGIKNFMKQDSTSEKWVLTSPFQAKCMDAFLTYANLKQTRE